MFPCVCTIFTTLYVSTICEAKIKKLLRKVLYQNLIKRGPKNKKLLEPGLELLLEGEWGEMKAILHCLQKSCNDLTMNLTIICEGLTILEFHLCFAAKLHIHSPTKSLETIGRPRCRRNFAFKPL